MSRAARFLVSGRVQGVCFRASTQEQGVVLGLDGVARNLDDGRVEVIVQGETTAVETLAKWLEHGPAAARVERIERSSWAGEVASGFVTA